LIWACYIPTDSQKYGKMGEKPELYAVGRSIAGCEMIDRTNAMGAADHDDRPVDTQSLTGQTPFWNVAARVRCPDEDLPSGRIVGCATRTPYSQNPCHVLVGFANAGYLSNPHKGGSQTGYVFTIGNTAISWRSTKQILVATSLNHARLLLSMKRFVSVYG
jgi:hypothetical protein